MISTRMSFTVVVDFLCITNTASAAKQLFIKIHFLVILQKVRLSFFLCLIFLFVCLLFCCWVWFFGAERTVKHFRKYFYPLDSAEGCHLVATWANSKPCLTIKCKFKKPWKSYHYQGQMIETFFLSSYVLIRIYLALYYFKGH